MNDMTWYSISQVSSQGVTCASCGKKIQLSEEFLGIVPDHHKRSCPHCNTECVVLDWEECYLQIVPSQAPEAIRRLIEIMQKEFNEVEMTLILDHLDEMRTTLTDN